MFVPIAADPAILAILVSVLASLLVMPELHIW